MRARQVLQTCLNPALVAMHALRRDVLMKAVEALVSGRRLTLIEVARSWPDALRVRAPLKALDRLLSNTHLYAEREHIYVGMVRWLVRSARPIIVIDWSDLKRDGSWFLLRAAIPVGGRTLPILDMVFAAGAQGTPKAEKQFLHRLKAILPAGTTPILVTDAGFRVPWFRAVEDIGWLWLGRLRHRTQVKPIDVDNTPDQWLPSKMLYELASSTPRDLGVMHTALTHVWPCRLVVHGKPPKGRKDRNRKGMPARRKTSRQNADREREPWLLVASPALKDLAARQLVALYSRRMQIELSFRDLKSHHYGNAFEDSLTRKGKRIEILLLIHAMAAFATWLVGMACEAEDKAHWLAARRSTRRLYSIMRLGREALVRRWPCGSLTQILDRLQKPSAGLLDQLGVPA